MKYYDNTDNFRDIVHTVEVTLQFEDYKGHIAYEISGSCQGLDLLDVDFYCIDSDDVKRLVKNDCNFNYDKDLESFSFILKNEKGEECNFEFEDYNDVNSKVVGINIIDCKVSD